MSIITSANLANAIVKLVAADALPALMGNLVMGNLVNRDYEPVLAHAGDTVNVPIPPVLVANNIAEGGTVIPQNPSLGNAQIVLNTHAEATFQIPDVTKALGVSGTAEGVHAAGGGCDRFERVERDLLNLYSQFTANTPLVRRGHLSPKRRSMRRRQLCSPRRCRPALLSTWWWIQTRIRGSVRFHGSANTTSPVKLDSRRSWKAMSER